MKKYFAEIIGTFALIFCGTGAMVINGESGGVITHAAVAATWGLIVAAMIYTLGDVSGAHLNPAVTIAFWVAKVFPAREILPYLISQAIGAFFARVKFSANGSRARSGALVSNVQTPAPNPSSTKA